MILLWLIQAVSEGADWASAPILPASPIQIGG